MEFYQAVKSLTPDDDEADRNDDEDQGDGKDDAELAGPVPSRPAETRLRIPVTANASMT